MCAKIVQSIAARRLSISGASRAATPRLRAPDERLEFSHKPGIVIARASYRRFGFAGLAQAFQPYSRIEKSIR